MWSKLRGGHERVEGPEGGRRLLGEILLRKRVIRQGGRLGSQPYGSGAEKRERSFRNHDSDTEDNVD